MAATVCASTLGYWTSVCRWAGPGVGAAPPGAGAGEGEGAGAGPGGAWYGEPGPGMAR